MISRQLAELTSPAAGEVAARGSILAIPLGSTEQHGPHLPLSTDTDIAVALSRRLASERSDVLVGPEIAYGSSGEHAGFAGTISIGQAALELLLVELGRSACETFEHLLLVSAHGGNASAVTRAVETLRYEGRDVSVFMPRWQGDPHAGHPETALQLAISPALVRPELAEVGDLRPLSKTLPLLRAGGVRAVSANGVLGDPRGATALAGSVLLEEMTASLVSHVERWRAA